MQRGCSGKTSSGRIVQAVVTLFREARRRKVFKTGALYVVGAWLLLQVADVLFPAFGISDAAIRTLVWAAAAGLPVALVFGWLFEIAPDGIRRTLPADSAALDAPRALKRAISSEPVFELQIGTGTAQFEDLRDVIGVRSLSHHAHPGTGAIELRVAVVEDEVIGEVLGRLKERGAPVLNLTKSEPTLETVFVHLVGRGLEDEDTDGQGA